MPFAHYCSRGVLGAKAVAANTFSCHLEAKRQPLIFRRLQRVVIQRSDHRYDGIRYVASIRRDVGPFFGE